MTACRRSNSAAAFAAVSCALIGAAVALTGCRDDPKEVVVLDSRPMRGQVGASSCSFSSAGPAIEWDSELEFGCAGGMPCPRLAALRPCADQGNGEKGDREKAATFERAIATEAGHDPGCNGIAIVGNTALGSGPVHQSIGRPHWVLEVAYVSSEESHPWLLVRHAARTIGGYGQGTAPEIAREMCRLVREGTASSQNRANSEPQP
jgi:hypothetical protein